MRKNPPNISSIQIEQQPQKPFRELELSVEAEASFAVIAQERWNTAAAFMQHMKARGAGMRRLETCAFAVRTLEVLDKHYMEITKKDLERWVVRMEKQYAPSTINLFKVTIKQFFKWLYIDDEDSKEFPAVVKWLKVSKLKADYGKHVLSKPDILKMMECTDNPRDRAIVHVLYESTCRASEFLDMKVKEVVYDQYGAVIRVNGKTGERRVRLVESVPELRLYMDMHPNRNKKESHLWVTTKQPYNKQSPESLQALIYKFAERAGLPKGISPHSFRHARATHLAPLLSEAQLRELFGWEKGSDMPSRYVHLSGKNVDDAVLRINGITPAEAHDVINPTAPLPCPRCSTQNSPAARFCMQCSSPLDAKTVLEIEQRTVEGDKITAKVIEAILQKVPGLVSSIVKDHELLSDIQKAAGVTTHG